MSVRWDPGKKKARARKLADLVKVNTSMKGEISEQVYEVSDIEMVLVDVTLPSRNVALVDVVVPADPKVSVMLIEPTGRVIEDVELGVEK